MEEITEDYVSFDTAKLLKEKGFDEYCLKNYWESDKELHDWTWELSYGKNSEKNTCCKDCSAPTLQMAMKWLRDVHNFHITAFPAWDNDDGTKMSFEKWGESIDGLDGEYCMPTSGPVYYNSYEEACEAAIKYVLENLI